MEEVHLREHMEGWQTSMERCFNDTEKEKEFVQMKECQSSEGFANEILVQE